MNNFIFAECTDTGRIRQVNEDSMASFDSPNGRVVVVCDGMGGMNAGDVASKLAVSVIKDILTDNQFPNPNEAITRSVIAANQAILNRASQNIGLSGMGATCVILIVKDGKVYYGSVGDSRIYYISGGSITQLTRDQSYVQALVDAGEISAEEAESHQDKNQIVNALGIETMTPPVLAKTPITPAPGSVFLLCSDGLSNMVKNDGIATIISRSDLSLQQKAETLVEAANEAGGVDNITVQLVEFAGSFSAVDKERKLKQEIKKNKSITYLLAAITILIVVGGGIAWYLTSAGNNKKDSESKEVVSKKKSQPVQTVTTKKEVIIVEKESKSAPQAKPVNKEERQKRKKTNNPIKRKVEKVKGSTTKVENPNPEEQQMQIRKSDNVPGK